ncbi:MAG: DUF1893 domain-containing protein [Clostridia bacterium]|nr:DUF1893 domain-containing protein [Clostridia bacterium]
MKAFSKSERLTLASMLLAVGIILPFAVSHGIGISGGVLLPMHVPVFLAGLLLGPVYGAGIGLVLPPLNTLLTGMPAVYPMMPMMTAELFTYGLVSGLLYRKTPLRKTKLGVYVAMLGAMAAGRVTYGITFEILMLVGEGHKATGVIAAFVTGIPGIVIQLLLVPSVVFTVMSIRSAPKENVFDSAKNLIARGKASCVVIKDGRIVSIESGRGIAPVIAMYEAGLLEGAVVFDKVIGKAAAEIMTLGGVKQCYGITMSKSAVDYLQKKMISVEYETLTDHIVNRSGDGVCPMEEAVKDIEDPEEALAAVKRRLEELRSQK